MAKELGMIHTVNHSMVVNASGDLTDIDIPGQLSTTLQRTIRQGNYFKCVGIDMSIDTVGTVGGGQVSGFLRYYAPTKGRCEAYRSAFEAMKKQMGIQGITPQNNPLYDFRAAFNNFTVALPNQATLDGTNGLCYYDAANVASSIFDVHNKSVRPTYTGTAGDLYTDGFDTILQSGAGTDFVLNDAIPFTGNPDTADVSWEYIPFTMSWTPDTTDIATSFQWRPDPALYLAILGGQFQLYVEELNKDGGAPALNLRVAVMVSGWKSIMGTPSKKSRSRRKAKADNVRSFAKMINKSNR